MIVRSQPESEKNQDYLNLTPTHQVVTRLAWLHGDGTSNHRSDRTLLAVTRVRKGTYTGTHGPVRLSSSRGASRTGRIRGWIRPRTGQLMGCTAMEFAAILGPRHVGFYARRADERYLRRRAAYGLAGAQPASRVGSGVFFFA